MDILPVLDLLKGRVVRGVAGRRETYAPVQSTIAASADPLTVARAFRQHFGFERLYIADLDAIMAEAPQWSLLESLIGAGFHLLVDAGLRNATLAERLISLGVDSIIVGLETLPGPSLLAELVSQFGPERIVFSLDLMQGRPLGNVSAWGTDDALSIAETGLSLGVTSLLILDLAAVGVASGVPTLELCRAVRGQSPQLKLISGGGVRSLSDLVSMQQSGVDAALVASALHDGRLTPDALAKLR